MIRPEDFVAKLEKVENLTENVLSLWFRPVGHKFDFEAGQFVMIKFQNPNVPGKEEQRAYSIASAPGSEMFELCVEIIPGGIGSNYIAGLNIGDDITFKAPFGMCVIKNENKNDLVMVATGTGIAPIKGILEDLASKNDSRRIDVFFGVRHAHNLLYVDQLWELEKNLPGMTLNITLSRPDDNWTGLEGRVTEHLAAFDIAHLPDFYICGNGDMIKDVRNFALEKGVDRKQIHVEIFD